MAERAVILPTLSCMTALLDSRAAVYCHSALGLERRQMSHTECGLTYAVNHQTNRTCFCAGGIDGWSSCIAWVHCTLVHL